MAIFLAQTGTPQRLFDVFRIIRTCVTSFSRNARAFKETTGDRTCSSVTLIGHSATEQISQRTESFSARRSSSHFSYINSDGVKKDFDAAYLWFYKAIVTSPEDERLYQSVQHEFFNPELMSCRDEILEKGLFNESHRYEAMPRGEE